MQPSKNVQIALLFCLFFLAACPAKQKSPLYMLLGETAANASLPTDWVQDACLKASNTKIADHFGWSVTISGDTLVVGAPTEHNGSTSINNTDNAAIVDSGTVNSLGAAYVFKQDGSGNWVQDAYLKASNAGVNHLFGISVAISGDTIVVGAEGEDNSSTAINNNDNAAIIDAGTATDAGAAYVFKKDGSGNWIQDAYLKASNTGAGGYFGNSVTVAGDTIVVGSYGESNSSTAINNTDNSTIIDAGTATEAGAAYVFKKDGSENWYQDAYLKPSNTESYDHFGWSVAISSKTVVVGAYQEDNSSTAINNTDNASIIDEGTATDSGAAYVFTMK